MMQRTKKQLVSFKMSRVKAKGSGIEQIMARALSAAGLRGYRKNLSTVLGTPDFCWKDKRVAVFCDSSFWHGYKWAREKKKIKVRKAFWFKKIEANIARDRRVTKALKSYGWKVFRYWDFEITKDPIGCVQNMLSGIDSKKN